MSTPLYVGRRLYTTPFEMVTRIFDNLFSDGKYRRARSVFLRLFISFMHGRGVGYSA